MSGKRQTADNLDKRKRYEIRQKNRILSTLKENLPAETPLPSSVRQFKALWKVSTEDLPGLWLKVLENGRGTPVEIAAAIDQHNQARVSTKVSTLDGGQVSTPKRAKAGTRGSGTVGTSVSTFGDDEVSTPVGTPATYDKILKGEASLDEIYQKSLALPTEIKLQCGLNMVKNWKKAMAAVRAEEDPSRKLVQLRILEAVTSALKEFISEYHVIALADINNAVSRKIKSMEQEQDGTVCLGYSDGQ